MNTSDTSKMPLVEAKALASQITRMLSPWCDRIDVAGSIRRECETVGDIEIICIPSSSMGGLFGDEKERSPGFCNVVRSMKKIKGEPEGKYTQRIYKSAKVDIFIASPENWGLIYAIRTGSAAFSHFALACRWKKLGYTSKDGMLTKDGKIYPIYEEPQLFEFLGMKWIHPRNRN